MNIKGLADAFAASEGTSKSQARDTIEAVFNTIVAAVKQGDEVALPAFGKFRVKHTPERKGRNPASGESITIKASNRLTFTPARPLKDALNSD